MTDDQWRSHFAAKENSELTCPMVMKVSQGLAEGEPPESKTTTREVCHNLLGFGMSIVT
ncbi:MAG: hypothetical protein HRU19_31060 [Pseudobacteriovorax sp.]|nr:hypothetical protein [Pseudobacteriovorax sp.]